MSSVDRASHATLLAKRCRQRRHKRGEAKGSGHHEECKTNPLVHMLSIPSLPITGDIADAVAQVLLNNPQFQTLLGNQVLDDPSFIPSAAESIAGNADFIANITNLVNENPSLVNIIATTLEGSTTFVENLTTTVGNNADFQSTVEQNLVTNPTFIQNLIPVLEDAGIAASFPEPEHTVYVSPVWSPGPSPTNNPNYFTSLLAAVQYINANRTDVAEPWGIVLYPGVYDASLPPVALDHKMLSMHSDLVKDIKLDFKRLVGISASYRQLAAHGRKDAGSFLSVISSGSIVRDVLHNTRTIESSKWTDSDDDTTMSDIATQTLQNASIHVSHKGSCMRGLDLGDGDSSLLMQSLSRSAVSTMTLGSFTEQNANSRSELSSTVLKSIFNTTLSNLSAKVLTLKSVCEKRGHGVGKSAFVPPTVGIPPNIHVTAAVSGTVFMNSDIFFQYQAPTSAASVSNRITGISFFDCNISWDYFTYDFVSAPAPELIFEDCTTAFSGTGVVNIDIAGPETLPLGSTLRPSFQWTNSYGANLASLLTANHHGSIDILDSHGMIVDNLSVDMLQLNVHGCTNTTLGVATTSLLPVVGRAVGITIDIQHSYGGFGQMIQNGQTQVLTYNVSSSNWRQLPPTDVAGGVNITVIDSFLQATAAVVYNQFPSILAYNAIITVPSLSIANTSSLELRQSSINATLNLGFITNATGVIDSCYVRNINFNTVLTSNMLFDITDCTIGSLTLATTVVNFSLSLALRSCVMENVVAARSYSRLSVISCVVLNNILIGASQPLNEIGLVVFRSALRGQIGTTGDATNCTLELVQCIIGPISTQSGFNWTVRLLGCVVYYAVTSVVQIGFGNAPLSLLIDNLTTSSSTNAAIISINSRDRDEPRSTSIEINSSSFTSLNISTEMINGGSNLNIRCSNSTITNVDFSSISTASRASLLLQCCNIGRVTSSNPLGSFSARNCSFSNGIFLASNGNPQSLADCYVQTLEFSPESYDARTGEMTSCQIGTLTDRSLLSRTYNSTTIFELSIIPPDQTPSNPARVMLNECVVSDTNMQNELYYVYKSCVLQTTRFLMDPNTSSPFAFAYNFLDCIMRVLNNQNPGGVLNYPASVSIAFYMNQCTLLGSMFLGAAPVTSTSVTPSPSPPFPYDRPNSQGNAIIVRSYVNYLSIVRGMKVSTPNQRWALSRNAVRRASFDTTSSTTMQIQSETNSNLYSSEYVIQPTVSVVSFSSNPPNANNF